jgi:putative tricarboxylic transport membrane protein
VVTCIDGYQMARQGRAGAALGISALGSYIGGTFSIFALMALAVPLGRFALSLGPAEYFALVMMGMTLVLYLSTGSLLRGGIMAQWGCCSVR